MVKENDELRASNSQLKLSLNDLKISMSDLKKKKKKISLISYSCKAEISENNQSFILKVAELQCKPNSQPHPVFSIKVEH